MVSDVLIVVGLIGLMFFLLMIGLEIGWSVGVVASIGMVIFLNQSLDELAFASWSALNSFIYSSVPLFIFMGSILGNSGVTEYLFDSMEKWLGRLPGGLAVSCIAGNAVFGAMCGSTVAATATFGKMAFPAMAQKGYDPRLSLGSIAVGSILAPLIPPSILLIVYGSWQALPIVSLLAGGLIPGLILATLFTITIFIWVKLNPRLAPKSGGYSFKAKISSTKNLLPFLAIIVGVLGGMFSGAVTPTEAAALGSFLALILTVVYKRFSRAMLQSSLLDSIKVTSMGLFILTMATMLSHVFNTVGISSAFRDYVINLGLGKGLTLVLFFVLYLVMGMFFDAWSMLFITFPLVIPVMSALDINLIWWGVIYVMAGEQSTVTPPFGLSLFVLHSVVPQHSLGTIARGALPFLLALYTNIAILTIFPQLVLWLPSKL